jgi:hypothetical protein
LAVLVLQKPRTSGHFNFGSVTSFIKALLTMYGNILGYTLDGSIKEPTYGKAIKNIVTSVIWKVIESEQGFLGVWTSPVKGSEQGNGQSAHENNTVFIQKSPEKKTNVESLSGVLSFLTKGLHSCPTFTMTIPGVPLTRNGSTVDHDNYIDTLVRRASCTASMSLDEHHDTSMVQTSVVFLMSLVRHQIKFLFRLLPSNFLKSLQTIFLKQLH